MHSSIQVSVVVWNTVVFDIVAWDYNEVPNYLFNFGISNPIFSR